MADFAAGLACRGGRRITTDRLHLTLAFIGAVDGGRRRAIEAMAATLAGTAFALQFDQVALWRRSGIVWAGCSQVPAGAVALHEALRGRLAGLGVAVERRGFHPHVTLFRRATALVAPPPPMLTWTCRDFVLAGSELDAAGARYRVLTRFPLGPASGPAYSG